MRSTFLARKREVPAGYDNNDRLNWYRCWLVEGGVSFTINDGRVPGGVATLSREEFERTFERVK